MKPDYPIRLVSSVPLILAACMLSWGAGLAGQMPVKPSAAVSTLPAVQPTGAVGSEAGPKQAPQHLDVSYGDGKLSVDATNASLNEILREVSHKTGMKITGGVLDDRVFGHYGPASPAAVLDALLEGTGSNVLLVAGSGSRPGGIGSADVGGVAANGPMSGSELILTPRRGGVSPPSPNAAAAQTGDAEEGAGMYVPPARPYLPPVPNGRSIGSALGADASSATNADGTDTGPKTPQQIYDQLQRTMQQKRGSTLPQQ